MIKKTYLNSLFAIGLCLVTSGAIATTYTCQAGKSDLVRFTAEVSASQVKIAFNKRQGFEGRNVAGRTVLLKPSSTPGLNNWQIFAGRTQTVGDFSDSEMDGFIFVRFGYLQTSQQDENLQVSFSLSPRSPAYGPRWNMMYGAVCRIQQ